MKILIVEDDASIRYGLEEVLSAEGYTTAACERGDGVVEKTVAGFAPDLIVMDVMMPGRNGFDCCRDLRSAGVRVPILMLTAKGQERDKVIGLECGADDYVTKPFSLPELTARIHALLRRATEFSTAAAGVAGSFRAGDCHVDPGNHTLRRDGEDISLSPRECALLVHLYRHRGRVLTRDQLLTSVWGVNAASVTTRTLDQTVAQLRKKLGDSAASPRWLITVHGVGYKLEDNGD
jgi:DNA-binding response OmpR family regulator